MEGCLCSVPYTKGFTLKILKTFQSTEGSTDLDSCFFRFVDGQLFDQVPSRGEIPDAEGVYFAGKKTLPLVRGSVGFFSSLESVQQSVINGSSEQRRSGHM